MVILYVFLYACHSLLRCTLILSCLSRSSLFYFYLVNLTNKRNMYVIPLVTELSQLPAPGYGTVYRHISEMLTYRTVGSGSH